MSGMEEVVSMIKSCIVINKGGLPLKELNSSYKELVGDSIPFKKFNHDSLESFLYSIPEVYISNSTEGKILTIDDPKLAHISDMVARQKTDTKKKKPRNSAQKNSVSYKIRPKVPASSLKVTNTGVNEIKSMIKCCIVTNKGGLRLSDLNRTYRQLVGESIQYKKYKYASLEDLVYNIPEVVVTETKDEILLTLSDPKLAHLSHLVANQKGNLTHKAPPRTSVSVADRGGPGAPPQEVRPKLPHADEDSSWRLQQEIDYTVTVMTSLLVINNGKLLLDDLADNYKDMVGDFIPYKKFNFKSLEQFVSSVHEFEISEDSCGHLVTLKDPVSAPPSKAIAKPKREVDEFPTSRDTLGHVTASKAQPRKAVAKPKCEANGKKESVKRPPSARVAKREQDQLKKQEKMDTVSMIKACLKVNGGELLMEDLDCYYEDLVGEFIPFQKFDHETLVEFLCDIPEILISKRRRGYLLTLDEPFNQNGVYASTRASLPHPSHAFSSNKCLLRNSLGSERDVRDLMFNNGMIRVTIKNDLCTKGSGETHLQPADSHGVRKSRA